GPAVIEISGATVSTVHDRPSGVGSEWAAAAIATTAKLCAPWASAVRLNGDMQAANAPPSTLHAKLTLASFEVNVKLALAIGTRPVGPAVIVVSGGVRSTTQFRVAGDGSRLPTASRTRTAKLCARSASAE